MQNLSQQNSQLHICVPQLNTLGHPSDFGLRRSHAGDHPQALPRRAQAGAWPPPPSQNCHANGCFTGFLDLILKQDTEASVGKETLSGYGVPGLHQWLIFQATFTQRWSKAGPHHTRARLWRKHGNTAFGDETRKKANPCSGVLQVFNWCSPFHVCLTVLRMPGEEITIPHLKVAS